MSAPAKPILVFQHIACEHPGVFRDFLAEDGIAWQPVELDEGEPIPPLEDYAALWVMGGPMDVWEEADHPWLVPEKAAIRTAVADLKMPFFGLCLGHQLLADALGGKAGPGTPEIGILDVRLTAAGRANPFTSGIDPHGRCLQWHGAEVQQAPPGAVVLAESDACAVQAMAIGETAFSLQYHVELTPTTVSDWWAVPGYRAALERSLGADAFDTLKAEADANLPRFTAEARRLYDNFMATTGLKT